MLDRIKKMLIRKSQPNYSYSGIESAIQRIDNVLLNKENRKSHVIPNTNGLKLRVYTSRYLTPEESITVMREYGNVEVVLNIAYKVTKQPNYGFFEIELNQNNGVD